MAVKVCRFDGRFCSYESCSFLVCGIVRLCVRYSGNPSGFHLKRRQGVSVAPVIFNKHLSRKGGLP